ncbi:MAG: hypothetical protein R3F59_37280 [Myxococcota bacterium]
MDTRKDDPTDRKEAAHRDGNEGEGNRTADRRYRERTEQFVEEHDTQKLGRDAIPHDEREARELKDAERAGKSRAREFDPEAEREG